MDGDDYFWFEGRDDDVITSSAYTISGKIRRLNYARSCAPKTRRLGASAVEGRLGLNQSLTTCRCRSTSTGSWPASDESNVALHDVHRTGLALTACGHSVCVRRRRADSCGRRRTTQP